MTKPRTRAAVLAALSKITSGELAVLRQAAVTADFWMEPGIHEDAFKRFKHEVKDHYFWSQSRRCCYCSSLLNESQASWDAEHVLDKSGHPEFMLELNNLAAACKPCNTAKGVKSPLVASLPKPATIPLNSADYGIVHPHIDEWEDHLEFDQYGRIRGKTGQPKGAFTVKVCRIEAINAAALSDHFSNKANKTAKAALFKFFTLKQRGTRRKYLEILDELAKRHNLAEAKAIVERLREEFVAGP